MKFINVNGVNIHYSEINPSAPDCIIFIHGNSHSLRTFRHQMSSQALQSYRLIALDLPGHGNSDHTHDYSLPFFVEILTGFVRTLNLENFILCGHSLGGHVAIESLPDLSPSGLFIFGTPPILKPYDPQAFKTLRTAEFLFTNHLSEEQITAHLSDMYSKRAISKEDLLEFKRTDVKFREIWLGNFLKGYFGNEVELLNSYEGQCEVITSDKDLFVSSDYISQHVSKDRIRHTDFSHCPHVEDFQEFNEILKSFCDRVFTPYRMGTSAHLEVHT